MARVTLRRTGTLPPVELVRAFRELTTAERLPRRLADAFVAMLTKNVQENAYGFTLSRFWLRLKELKGWDERPFIAEGHYLDMITVDVRDGKMVVGFTDTAVHPRSGMNMAELAVLLEWGRLDKGLVARPLWRNTMRDFFALIGKDTKVEIKKLLKNARRI